MVPCLQVAETADSEDLKKAKRKKVLLTHPDKLGGVVGCNEAFARVTEVSESPSAGQNRYRLCVQSAKGSPLPALGRLVCNILCLAYCLCDPALISCMNA